MEVQKDIQLLNEDDDNESSQMCSPTKNSMVRTQTRGTNSSITVNINNNNIDNFNNSYARPRSSKFNISPNNPSCSNTAINNPTNRLELKSIERPRSHSPLKMKGIEEYIQLYATNNSNSNANSTDLNNKITMNLKMDDLLANVKNDSNSYQALADFSFMTGDQVNDVIKTRRKSLNQNSSLKKDDEWLSNKLNNIEQLNSNYNNNKNNNNNINKNNDDYDDYGNDDDDDDDNKKENNLNYKFTAVYTKDEATGSFQEQSKIIFESKSLKTNKLPPPPPPPQQQPQQQPQPPAQSKS